MHRQYEREQVPYKASLSLHSLTSLLIRISTADITRSCIQKKNVAFHIPSRMLTHVVHEA